MNRITHLAGAVLLGTVVSFSRAVAPSPQDPPPAATGAAAPTSYSSVLVLPFSPVEGASEWIGKGVQEDLATELVRQSRLDVLTPADAQAVSDPAAAVKIGRDKGASLVAFGTYQILDTDVRINGQLVDTNTGKAIAALKATGPRRDLFHMEDLLAAQAVSALPPGSVKVGGGAYASSNEPAPAPAPASTNYYGTQPSEPYNSQGYYVTAVPDYTPTYDYTASAPATTYYSPGYSTYSDPYPYGYPWYGYNYPFWGSGFFFIGGDGHRHHDHDGDHDHDGHWNNGTEGHRVGVNNGNGVGVRSPVIGGGTRSVRSFNGGGTVRTSPGLRGSVGTLGRVGGLRSFGGVSGGISGGGGVRGGGGARGGGAGHR